MFLVYLSRTSMAFNLWKKHPKSFFESTAARSSDFCCISQNSEAISRMCSVKKIILKILQNSQENTCARVSFLFYKTEQVRMIGVTNKAVNIYCICCLCIGISCWKKPWTLRWTYFGGKILILWFQTDGSLSGVV